MMMGIWQPLLWHVLPGLSKGNVFSSPVVQRVWRHSVNLRHGCAMLKPESWLWLQEEQLLELVMNGMRVAGIALALQALSTVALGEAPTPEQTHCRGAPAGI